MDTILKYFATLFLILSISISPNELAAQFSKYWYNGDAEITSYKLEQARYGEIRNGTAVMIFVTEPFSPTKFVKADYPTDTDVSVLKLNYTKNFNTGIYPYSMMNSTFVPVKGEHQSLKISSSSQEWCGHTFMELKNNNEFEISIHSYFEEEDAKLNIAKNLLEDDFWSMIRLDPNNLPIGSHKVIPSFFYLRLSHIETKAYTCLIEKNNIANNEIEYKIAYPELNRTLTIYFDNEFPYYINSWTESLNSGFGNKKQQLLTKGTRINRLKIPYWNKNSNVDEALRKELGLP